MLEVVLFWQGDIDYANAETLGVELLAHMASARANARIVLDMSGVTFLDSVGISVLVRARSHALRDHLEFLLRNPSARTIRLLEVVGLHDLFRIETTDV